MVIAPHGRVVPPGSRRKKRSNFYREHQAKHYPESCAIMYPSTMHPTFCRLRQNPSLRDRLRPCRVARCGTPAHWRSELPSQEKQDRHNRDRTKDTDQRRASRIAFVLLSIDSSMSDPNGEPGPPLHSLPCSIKNRTSGLVGFTSKQFPPSESLLDSRSVHFCSDARLRPLPRQSRSAAA
jgi:hypothetical protein